MDILGDSYNVDNLIKKLFDLVEIIVLPVLIIVSMAILLFFAIKNTIAIAKTDDENEIWRYKKNNKRLIIVAGIIILTIIVAYIILFVIKIFFLEIAISY